MYTAQTAPAAVAASAGGVFGQTFGARPTLIFAGVGAAVAAVSILATKVPHFKSLSLAA